VNFTKLLAMIGVVAVILGISVICLPVLMVTHTIGDMHGAGYHPQHFALEARLSGIIVTGTGVILLIAAAVIDRRSD
jgi:hypothetical protein